MSRRRITPPDPPLRRPCTPPTAIPSPARHSVSRQLADTLSVAQSSTSRQAGLDHQPARRSARVPIALLAFVVVFGGTRCVSFAPGIEVSVGIRPARPTVGDGIDEAGLVVSGVELLPCEMAAMGWLGTRRASAHSTEDLSAPARIDARHNAGVSHGLDLIRPEPGRYCTLRLHLQGDPSAWLRSADRNERRSGELDLDLELPELLDLHEAGMTTIDIEFAPVRWQAGTFEDAFEVLTQ